MNREYNEEVQVDSMREILFKAYEHLLSVKGECSCETTNQCGISDLTIRQIEYLKLMDMHTDITFSKIAALTRTSKPTVSELINKLIRLDCIYKETSPTDRRVSYIFLTRKGKGIARIEKTTMLKVVDRILASLNQKEVTLLIKLFNKVV
ncbi:MAG: winged helix-turn-helix transcriptional regulator [Spirochaetales bacterium]|nr:winged helix-turn-helix transcriptional regulator [Spirochaetales bacterium]